MASIPNPPAPPKEAIATVQKYIKYTPGEHQDLINRAIQLLSKPLGDAGKLERVRNAWNITGAAQIATATNGITQARLELTPLWAGTAATAFNGYALTLIGQSNTLRGAMNTVGTALTNVHQQIYDTIVAVTTAMNNCAIAIARYLENVANSVTVDVFAIAGQTTGALLGFLADLAMEFSKLWTTAIQQVGLYRKNLNQAMTAIANIGENPVATLPVAATDPDNYQPVKKPSS